MLSFRTPSPTAKGAGAAGSSTGRSPLACGVPRRSLAYLICATYALRMPPPGETEQQIILWNATVRQSGVIRVFVGPGMRGSGWAALVDKAIAILNQELSGNGIKVAIQKVPNASNAGNARHRSGKRTPRAKLPRFGLDTLPAEGDDQSACNAADQPARSQGAGGGLGRRASICSCTNSSTRWA